MPRVANLHSKMGLLVEKLKKTLSKLVDFSSLMNEMKDFWSDLPT